MSDDQQDDYDFWSCFGGAGTIAKVDSFPCHNQLAQLLNKVNQEISPEQGTDNEKVLKSSKIKFVVEAQIDGKWAKNIELLATRGYKAILGANTNTYMVDISRIRPVKTNGAKTLPDDWTQQIEKFKKEALCRYNIGQKLEVTKCSDAFWQNSDGRITYRQLYTQVRKVEVMKVCGSRMLVKNVDSECEDVSEVEKIEGWYDHNSELVHDVGFHENIFVDNHSGHSIVEINSESQHSDDHEIVEASPEHNNSDKECQTNNDVGKQLECIDPFRQKDIDVVEITKVLNQGYFQLLSHSLGEFVLHSDSKMLLPIGFNEKHKISGAMRNLRWDKAKYTLKQKPTETHHSFKVGDLLEVADCDFSEWVGPARIVAVVDDLIKITFLGWEQKYQYEKWQLWHHYTSPNLYPAGWCQFFGYQMSTDTCQEQSDERKQQRNPKRKAESG